MEEKKESKERGGGEWIMREWRHGHCWVVADESSPTHHPRFPSLTDQWESVDSKREVELTNGARMDPRME